jgi:hypothetical protein
MTRGHESRFEMIWANGNILDGARAMMNCSCSSSAAKPVKDTAIAFRWFPCGQAFEVRHRFALLRHLSAQRATRLCFPVQGLRNRRGAPHFAEQHDLHLKVPTFGLDLQEVTDAHRARALGRLAVGGYPAQFTCSCRQRASLEKSSRPEPLVHAYIGHTSLSSILAWS